MAEVRVDISGTSPVKPAGAKKKTVKFVASSKKFKVIDKPPSALGLPKITDDVTPQLGDGVAFDINNDKTVIPTSTDWPSLKTEEVDRVNFSVSAHCASTDPSDKEDEPKTSSLTDLSSSSAFSVRVRRASQPSRTKLSPAALKARCKCGGFLNIFEVWLSRTYPPASSNKSHQERTCLTAARLSGGDLFHLYTRRFMNTFLRRQPPRQDGNIISTKPDTQTGGKSDACTAIPSGVPGTTAMENSGDTSQEEMEQSLDTPEESSKELPAVFTEVDDEIQFRSDRVDPSQGLVELDNC
ncbi:hypothetical protein Bbelb_404570 [Branchiostoma belcheri]|nr:hypothetical protein Bbelb_404570 [Branchiostoma belcheri]